MGCAFYCSNNKCDMGFDYPTAREDIEGVRCPKCNTLQRKRMTEAEWIINIDERLRELENK